MASRPCDGVDESMYYVSLVRRQDVRKWVAGGLLDHAHLEVA